MELAESAKRRITENLDRVHRMISAAASRAGRDPDGITLVAVTKTVSINEIEVLIECGVKDLGESRVQTGLDKMRTLDRADVRWHMIGHLQRNKVRKVIGNFATVHSVDSIRLLREIEKQADVHKAVLPVFLQVNTSGEETKFGTTPSGVKELASDAARSAWVEVMGLMTMAPYGDEPEASRPYFRELAGLRDRLQDDLSCPLPHLSMGMTGDFEVAIEEGATFLRIGTALFE